MHADSIQGSNKKFQRNMLAINSTNCQRASLAKTRGWRGGSIIEPCECTVQAEKISSDRETCL